MKAQLEQQLEQDFFFMRKSRIENEKNLYKSFGCECGDGWYDLIHDLCQSISERYECDGKSVNIVILQVKEKFASLRFYYEFEGVPCPIQALDSLGDGTGLRFVPNNNDTDEATKQLRKDISEIVLSYEKKSETVCEICGAVGKIRMDMPWKRTLCENCYSNYLKKVEESKKKHKKDINTKN